MNVTIKIALTAAAIAALVSCASTTDKGVVGADRRQLLLVSEPQIAEMANKAYNQVLAEARKAGTLNTEAAQLRRVRAITARLIPQVAIFRPDAIKWQWETNVITSDELNAWCMHGGKIAVYTGIIEKLKLDGLSYYKKFYDFKEYRNNISHPGKKQPDIEKCLTLLENLIRIMKQIKY